MPRFALLSLFGFSLITSAFGGGTVTWPYPSTPPGANPAATPAPRMEWFQRVQDMLTVLATKPVIDLVFDGDSITDNWQNIGKEVWTDRYGNRNSIDLGIGGDRTQSILWRLQNGQADNLHPKLIALMIGTNNLSDNTVEQIADGIKAIVTDYRQHCPDAVILLQGIFPRGEQSTDPARAKIKAINQIISQYADGKNVIYIDFGDKFLQPDGSISRDMMPDFLHPTAKGYQIWADAIQPIIDKYVPAY